MITYAHCGDIKTHILGNRNQKKKDLSKEKEGENWQEEKLKQENKEENIRELSLYFRGIAMDTHSGGLYCYNKKNKEMKTIEKNDNIIIDDLAKKKKKKKTTSTTDDITREIISNSKKKKLKTRKTRKNKKRKRI